MEVLAKEVRKRDGWYIFGTDESQTGCSPPCDERET